MARRIRFCSLWSIILYRRHRAHPGTGDRIRLPAHPSRRHVVSCPALELYRRFRVHAFCRALSGESGCRGLCVDGGGGLRPGDESEQAIDPVRVSPPISVGRIGSSRPELRMSGTNQMRPASSARMHQTKWCDRDLRFAANSEPTCSAVAGKMEAKVTASGAGLLACF